MLNEKELDHVLELAKIACTEQERALLLTNMADITKLMDTIKDAPMDMSAKPITGELTKLRADEVHPSLTTAQVLQNAPEQAANLFKVPGVMD